MRRLPSIAGNWKRVGKRAPGTRTTTAAASANAADLYAAALLAGLGGQNVEPDGQSSKEDFFYAGLRDLR